MKWTYYNYTLLPECDPRINVKVTELEKKSLFKQYKSAILLRYTTDFDYCDENKSIDESWYYCIKDTPFDFDSLKSKRKNVLRKAVRNFTVKQIKLSDYIEEFYVLLNDAFQAYPIPPVWSYEKCADYCESVTAKEGSLVLGAFSNQDGRFVGYLWLDIRGKSISMVAQHVMREYEKAECNAALDYALCELYNEEYFDRGYYLCDGERTVLHETSFQGFLVKYFGFRYAPCRLYVCFNPKYDFIIKLALKTLPFYGLILKRIKPSIYNKVLATKKLYDFAVKDA